MKLIEKVHQRIIYERRLEVLVARFAGLIPENAKVLDIGCGDGFFAKKLLMNRPDISVRGIDILLRPKTFIPVNMFNGSTIDAENSAFDVALFVDVLHHTGNPVQLLSEAKRVCSKAVIIKDHLNNNPLDERTLRFMDDIGNKRHGVQLSYDYWSEKKWTHTFDRLGFTMDKFSKTLNLYPFPINLLFDRHLHFIASLKI